MYATCLVFFLIVIVYSAVKNSALDSVPPPPRRGRSGIIDVDGKMDSVPPPPQRGRNGIVEVNGSVSSSSATSPASSPATGGSNELPEGWIQKSSSNGDTYYYNTASGESSWVVPGGEEGGSSSSSRSSENVAVAIEMTGENLHIDAFKKKSFRKKGTLMPEGWTKGTSSTGDKYYVKPDGESTQWEKPPGNN